MPHKSGRVRPRKAHLAQLTAELPAYQTLRERFRCCIDTSTADRASANIRAELSLSVSSGVPRLRLPCLAHIASTSQARSLAPAHSVISGVIAASLAQQPTRAAEKLRSAIALTLWENLVIVRGPAGDSPHRNRLLALLDLSLGSSESDLKRKHILLTNLSGDTMSKKVVWRTSALHPDGWRWCEMIAEALYPAPIPVFPRHRWVTSHSALQGYALLDIHKVLEQSFPKWLDELQGRRPHSSDSAEPAPTAVRPALSGRLWCLPESSDSDADQEPDTQQTFLCETAPQDSSAWHQWNRKMQTSARGFAASKPGAPLLLSLVASTLAAAFLARVESIASQKWESDQWAEFVNSGSFKCRMDVGVRAKLRADTFVDAERLFTDASAWSALPPGDATWQAAGLAFTMISASICCMSHLVFEKWEGFPYCLWSLVSDSTTEVAERLLARPVCMRDPWSSWFLLEFATPERLLHEGRAALVGLGCVLRWEITRIECRHAALNRSIKASGTWAPLLEAVSSDFVLMRMRIMERWLTGSAGTGADGVGRRQKRRAVAHGRASQKVPWRSRKRRSGRCAGARTGGGGPQRRLMSMLLSGQKWRTASERRECFAKANRRYKLIMRQGGAAMEQLVREGAAGTQAHRAGGFAFVGKRKFEACDGLARRLESTGDSAVCHSRRLGHSFVRAIGPAIDSQRPPARSNGGLRCLRMQARGRTHGVGMPMLGQVGGFRTRLRMHTAAACLARRSWQLHMLLRHPTCGGGRARLEWLSNQSSYANGPHPGDTNVGTIQPLAEMKRALDLNEAVQQHRIKLRLEAERVQRGQEAIVSWSRAARDEASRSCALVRMTADACVTPAAFGNVDRVVNMVPPVKEMARRSLTTARRKRYPLQLELAKFWELRHLPMLHSRVPACKAPPRAQSRPRLCSEAGVCLCGGTGKASSPLASATIACFRKAFKKKKKTPDGVEVSEVRRLYDAMSLFIRVFNKREECFWHVGYGNLNTWEFTLLPLVRVGGDSTMLTAVAQVSIAPVNIYRAMHGKLLTSTWKLEFWGFSDCLGVIPGPFTPELVQLKRLEGRDGRPNALFRVHRQRRRRSAICDGVAEGIGQAGDQHIESGTFAGGPLPADAGDPASDVSEGEGDPGGIASEAQTCSEHGDRRSSSSSTSSSGAESGSDGENEGDIGRCARQLRAACERTWQVESESDTEDPAAAGSQPIANGGRAGEPQPPPAEQPPAEGESARLADARDVQPARASPPAPPPTPPPPRAEAGHDRARGPRSEPQAPRGSRGSMWGPFMISQVMRDGAPIGWGLVCGRHTNSFDQAACKKQLTYGRDGLTDAMCVSLLKQWALAGYSIPPDEGHGRYVHVTVKGNLRSSDYDRTLADDVLDDRLASAQSAA